MTIKHVGARRASPVKYAVGVFSVNILFTSCHKIIAHNANNTRCGETWRARRASPLQNTLVHVAARHGTP